MQTIGFTDHDHSTCIATNLALAEERCRTRGLQLTRGRRRVLEILLQQHRAMGAYDILEHLRKNGMGAQPPTAYRALEFLVSQGLAHKIEHLNAFIACDYPGTEHAPAFLICRDCNNVAEAHSDDTRQFINRTANRAGFETESAIVEFFGLCPNCRND